jgi:hypothetical protein
MDLGKEGAPTEAVGALFSLSHLSDQMMSTIR